MTQSITLVHTSELSDVAQYAYAAIVPPHARLVFLAGACPLDVEGVTVGVGDYAAQAAQAIKNMEIALAAAGATIKDVVHTRVLVASAHQTDLVAAWTVVRDAFGDHDAPSTLMGVAALGYTDQLVEIEAVAAVSV